MKIKPAGKSGKVVVELDEKESPGPLARPLSPIRIKKILVPTDFSECARQALRHAIPFATEFDASLVLVFVAQLSFPGSEFADVNLPRLESSIRESADEQLRQLAQESIPAGIPVQTVVRVGQPVDEIVRTAEELDVDLIIMSTHGRTGLAHMLMGSTAEKVVRYARCPVLVVRERESAQGTQAE